MSLYVKQNGTVVEPTEVYVKQGGVQVAATEVWVKAGGTVKQVWPSDTPPAGLAQYYASGAIPFHISAADAVLNGGNVDSIPNRSSGPDVTASGTVPVSGGMMQFDQGGYLQLTTEIELSQKAILIVSDNMGTVNGGQWAGSDHSGTGGFRNGLRANTSATNGWRLQLWSEENRASGASITNWGGGFISPADAAGPHIWGLYLDLANSELGGYFDDIDLPAATLPSTVQNFPTDRLGAGALITFDGTIGDIIVVDMTQPDAADALAAARDYLISAYSITPPPAP